MLWAICLSEVQVVRLIGYMFCKIFPSHTAFTS